LEAHPDHEPDRKCLCHGPQSHPENQGLPEPQNRPRYGLQADDVSQEEVEENLRAKPSDRSHPGVEFKDGIKQLQTAA
jgi:hypothetical protein